MDAIDPDDPVVIQRRHLHDAVAGLPALDPALPDNAYLSGWVTIAEFVDPDGSKWWVTRRGTDGGDRDLMPWTEKGFLHHLLDQWTAKTIIREADDDDE